MQNALAGNTSPPERDAKKRTESMLPELNDVITESDEEEDEDEFQMLERLTREIDGLAAPAMTSSSREYSSPLSESIKAFVGKRHDVHHIPRGGNALNSGGSGGFPSKKNAHSNNTNEENGSRRKNERRLASTTRGDEMMRRKSHRNQRVDDEANALERVLSKYRALKRAFRKLSEDYDHNLALFNERDEALDLFEERLKIEKMKTTRYRERVRELERELALRETTAVRD